MKRSSAAEYQAGPVVWFGVIVSTCLLLHFFHQVLWLVVPFVLALVLYYLLLPIKHRLVLSGLSHDMAATVVSLVVGGLVIVALTLFLPWLTVEAFHWEESSDRYVDGGMDFLTAALKQLEGHFSVLAKAKVSDALLQHVSEFGEHFVQNYLAGVLMTLAAWAPSVLLVPFLAFFMLRDGWRFSRFIGRSVPNAFFERSLSLIHQIDRTARLYFVGLLKLTALDTLCLASGLWLMGISSPLLLGLVAAVLSWVPYVGSIAGCLIVVLVAATDFPGQAHIAYGAVALFIFVRMLDDFIFMPMTVGKSLNIHPLLTVVMIFAGGAVAGITGLMLVLPVLGVVMVLGETLGLIVTDTRLLARHAHAKRLRQREAASDLS